MKAIALLGGPKEEWPQEIAADIKKARKEGALIMASDRGIRNSSRCSFGRL